MGFTPSFPCIRYWSEIRRVRSLLMLLANSETQYERLAGRLDLDQNTVMSGRMACARVALGGRRPPQHEFANGIAFERTAFSIILRDPLRMRAASEILMGKKMTGSVNSLKV
jgi:hypothetical protein